MYHASHIDLRYFIARSYYPYDLLETLYKTEKDLSELYYNFKKTLKPPFDKILSNDDE